MSGTGLGHRLERIFIDLTLAAAIGYLGYGVVTSALAASGRDARLRVAEQEAHVLYDAFQRYHERNHQYPASHTDPRFDVATLDPLRKRGYYTGGIQHYLLGGRIDAYDSPDDRGPNREYWLEMTLADDPSIRILVARSDDAPLGRGEWRDGVFIYRQGRLEPR